MKGATAGSLLARTASVEAFAPIAARGTWLFLAFQRCNLPRRAGATFQQTSLRLTASQPRKQVVAHLWTFYMDFLLFSTTKNSAALNWLPQLETGSSGLYPTSSYTMHPKPCSVNTDINTR
jgi:hypothetical protein